MFSSQHRLNWTALDIYNFGLFIHIMSVNLKFCRKPKIFFRIIRPWQCNTMSTQNIYFYQVNIHHALRNKNQSSIDISDLNPLNMKARFMHTFARKHDYKKKSQHVFKECTNCVIIQYFFYFFTQQTPHK